LRPTSEKFSDSGFGAFLRAYFSQSGGRKGSGRVESGWDGVRLFPPRCFVEQGLQGGELHRLDEVSVKAGLFRLQAVLVLPPASQGDDGDLPAPVGFADAAAGLVAVELGHADV